MSTAIVPKSDQLNSDDLLAGPVTVTITEVRQGNQEQPVVIELLEYPGRPFKPSKTVSRILVAAWGRDSTAYTGHKLTLYRDPEVKWGGESVGGIRVMAMSHIEKPLRVNLTATRGKKKEHVIHPLIERDFLAELAQTNGDIDAISALGKAATQAGADAAVIGQIRDTYNTARGAESGS